MRIPFLEVVTQSAGMHSGFPPLQTRKQPLTRTKKGNTQHDVKLRDYRWSWKLPEISGTERVPNIAGEAANVITTSINNSIDVDLFLQIGSNVVPVDMSAGDLTKGFASLKHIAVYIGFVHECPHSLY